MYQVLLFKFRRHLCKGSIKDSFLFRYVPSCVPLLLLQVMYVTPHLVGHSWI